MRSRAGRAILTRLSGATNVPNVTIRKTGFLQLKAVGWGHPMGSLIDA